MRIDRWVWIAVVLLSCTASVYGQESGNAPQQPAGPSATQKPERIPGAVIAGNLVTHVNPVYPKEAKAKGIEGAVVLHVIIGKDGKIEKVEAISGPDLLRQASIDAISQWRYKPYLLNGEPTRIDTTVTANFNLNKSPKH
jgi:protein TonB